MSEYCLMEKFQEWEETERKAGKGELVRFLIHFLQYEGDSPNDSVTNLVLLLRDLRSKEWYP